MSAVSRARRTSKPAVATVVPSNKPSELDTLTPAERQLVSNHRAKVSTFSILDAVDVRRRRQVARHNTTTLAIMLTVLALLFIGPTRLFAPLFDGTLSLFSPIIILALIWLASLIGLLRFATVKEY